MVVEELKVPSLGTLNVYALKRNGELTLRFTGFRPVPRIGVKARWKAPDFAALNVYTYDIEVRECEYCSIAVTVRNGEATASVIAHDKSERWVKALKAVLSYVEAKLAGEGVHRIKLLKGLCPLPSSLMGEMGYADQGFFYVKAVKLKGG